ncbi:LRR and NB-ARC domain disease resistance protein [Trifolium medium]|uniref:LRR and NB-ARC domain disease resistance protein n=1 Tax=Trifolium medium TaxID=97028 RepID=A0A392M929_9FABA|nr:LRR and NB-ARC domain disease resistance protein [Trifolium medium]
MEISENGKSSLSGIVRRLSIGITFSDLPPCIESSHVRSLLVFTNYDSPPYFENIIPKNYKLLRVLDVESTSMGKVPENLGSFVHLKYLSLGDAYECEFLEYIGMLRSLETLNKLPEWIPKLQNLVDLRLSYSGLTEDPLKSLNCLQHLLSLYIAHHAYEGLCLHFEDGWFQKLKQLVVLFSSELRDVIIDKGALSSLKKLDLFGLKRLKKIPTGIQHLEKFEDLRFSYMSDEFVQNISTED